MAKFKILFILLFTWALNVFLCVDIYAQQPLHGVYKEFHPNGKVKVKGHYNQGSKTGNWFYYTDKKILEKREFFKNGNLKRTYSYNEKGQLAVIEDDKGNVIIKPACGCQ
jgi:antitoxin component YwqK of YwqJK toxin-antitoxin module